MKVVNTMQPHSERLKTAIQQFMDDSGFQGEFRLEHYVDGPKHFWSLRVRNLREATFHEFRGISLDETEDFMVKSDSPLRKKIHGTFGGWVVSSPSRDQASNVSVYPAYFCDEKTKGAAHRYRVVVRNDANVVLDDALAEVYKDNFEVSKRHKIRLVQSFLNAGYSNLVKVVQSFAVSNEVELTRDEAAKIAAQISVSHN